MSIYTLLHVCVIAMIDLPAKQTGGQAIDKLGHFGSAQCKDGAWEMEKGLPRINLRQIGSLDKERKLG